MKKLSFLFAMMLVASMSMAQKTAWIYQTGNSNHADITQVSAAPFVTLNDANKIYATQSGDLNELTTSQTGQDNYIWLDQKGYNNKAKMEQLTVDVHYVGNNNADISQGGAFNKAILTQKEKDAGPYDIDRSNNVAKASQYGISGYYKLDQGRSAFFPTNTQSLMQSGKSNTADIDQLGFTNWSSIKQLGYYNKATLDQAVALVEPISWNKSYSWQSNGGNDLKIKQIGLMGYQLAESYQNGDGAANTTTIKQIGAGPEDVYSIQSGVNDIIHVSQTY